MKLDESHRSLIKIIPMILVQIFLPTDRLVTEQLSLET